MAGRVPPLVVTALTAAALVACGGRPGAEAGPGDLGMAGNVFTPAVRQIEVDESLTFVNDSSHSLHILVIGDRAEARDEPGAPRFGGSGGVRTDPGESWTSPPWRTPGTYHVTCTLHPDMNLEVRVLEA